MDAQFLMYLLLTLAIVAFYFGLVNKVRVLNKTQTALLNSWNDLVLDQLEGISHNVDRLGKALGQMNNNHIKFMEHQEYMVKLAGANVEDWQSAHKDFAQLKNELVDIRHVITETRIEQSNVNKIVHVHLKEVQKVLAAALPGLANNAFTSDNVLKAFEAARQEVQDNGLEEAAHVLDRMAGLIR